MVAHNTFDGRTTHLMFFGAIHVLSSVNKNKTKCALGHMEVIYGCELEFSSDS